MDRSRAPTSAHATIAALAAPARIAHLSPIAARFIYSLRLMAMHERAARDPVPELAARLGCVDVTARALALAQVVAATWPEDINLTRFCCPVLTHDEVTIAALVEAAAHADPLSFDAAICGFVRSDRAQRLWEPALALIAAEARAA